jgi:branched-chain amino acid transport system permease protein
MLSIAHAAFFGIGAYATALTLLNWQFSFGPALLFGGVFTLIVATLVGIPATRLTGDYLVVASLGFAIIVHALLLNLTDITRGSMGLPGIPSPDLFGYSFKSSWERTGVIYAIVLICGLITWRLSYSPFGRVLKSIRDDPLAAAACGKNVFAFKVTVFAVSAGLAGIAGGLYATYVQFIDPESFVLQASFIIVMAVILGGRGTFWGPLVGAAVIWIIPESLRFLNIPPVVKGALNQVIYAVLLILILLFRSRGILGHLAYPKRQPRQAEPLESASPSVPI